MPDQQKRIASSRLAQAKATVFTAHHWHEGDKTHRERFEIYTELVKMCTRKAFVNHRELVIGIAKQGGWQKYESDFYKVLRRLPDEFNREGVYRKANFELLSAVRPGVQLADFYVGTVRDFIIDESERLCYELLQEQIVTRDIYTLVPAETER